MSVSRSATAALSAEQRIARLRWQCRRGMLELDLLLQAFAHARLAELDEGDLDILTRFLAYPDQILFEWLMGYQRPMDPELARVVELVRSAPAD